MIYISSLLLVVAFSPGYRFSNIIFIESNGTEKIICKIFRYKNFKKNENYHICTVYLSKSNKENLSLLNQTPKLKSIEDSKIHEFSLRTIINDPDYPKMWHIRKSVKNPIWLYHNVKPLWLQGITGQGIKVAVIDAGVDTAHRDLEANHYIEGSKNFDDTTDSPADKSNLKHGTMCAGIISAVGNNNFCGAGIAYSSNFSILTPFIQQGEKMIGNLDNIGNSFSHLNDQFHIYSCSWGSNDDGESMEYSQDVIVSSLKNGFDYVFLILGYDFGRKNKGNIYIFGSGNGGGKGDNCGFDHYLQKPETLVFGPILQNGSIPWYAEQCTAILASALSSHFTKKGEGLYSTFPDNECDNYFAGSSVSSAVASGLIALLIQVNPSLMARDITKLIIETSTQHDENAILNAAGFRYSTYLGFGFIEITELVKIGGPESFKPFKPLHICYTRRFTESLSISRINVEKYYIYSSGCYLSDDAITKIEAVYIRLTVVVKERNQISIYLVSPSGTSLPLIIPRKKDTKSHIIDYTVKVLGFYGELPFGVWIVKLKSHDNQIKILGHIELIIHGINDGSTKIERKNLSNIRNICINRIFARSITPGKDGLDRLSFTHFDYKFIRYL